MPTEARGNYLPEPPLLTRDKDLSQPVSRVDTTCWQFFNIPLSIRPIVIFCCINYVKLLDYWRAEKFFLYFRRPPCGLRPVAFATSATWLIRHCTGLLVDRPSYGFTSHSTRNAVKWRHRIYGLDTFAILWVWLGIMCGVNGRRFCHVIRTKFNWLVH